MKRASPSNDEPKPRKGGIRWDEENLELNEKIKQELNPRKIDEPPTPYLSPQGTEDEAEMLEGTGMSPLSLDDRPGPVRVSRQHASPWSDSSDQNGSPSPQYPSSNGRSSSRSPRFSGDYYVDGSDEEETEGNGVCDGEVQVEKRRKFREARKAHYEMKEAMEKAKELLKSEEEDEGVEEVEKVGMEVEK